MGGIFIAFGGALAVSVGPNCPGVAQSNPGLLKMITGATAAVLAVPNGNHVFHILPWLIHMYSQAFALHVLTLVCAAATHGSTQTHLL